MFNQNQVTQSQQGFNKPNVTNQQAGQQAPMAQTASRTNNSLNNDLQKVITGTCRLSYCNLLQPRAPLGGGDPKYSVKLLIPKSDNDTMTKISVAIQTAADAGKETKWNGVAPANPPHPVHDGDGTRQDGTPFEEECKGHWVVTASTVMKPQIVDANLTEIIDATQIYSGMYGRASIRFYPYNAAGRKGIACGLGNIQKIQDGEPLGGRTTAEQDFDALVGDQGLSF